MKQAALALLGIILLASCGHKNVPDVSGIHINVQVQRFEKDLFSMDTTDMFNSLQQLSKKYPYFLTDYLENILGLPPLSDTTAAPMLMVRQFIREYRPIKDSAEKLFDNFDHYEEDIKQGLRFVVHYFPHYNPPPRLITYVGPIEGYSEVLTRDALAVGLQLHLGRNFFLYSTDIGQETYPTYISRRFTPDYITANCMKNIINDIVPENLKGKPLVEQMIEKGKRLYVLDKILPYTQDTIKTGYTDSQLKGCYSNEKDIWNFFLTNSLLDSKDQDVLKDYLDEGPNTPALGERSPGYIGLFVGWQIVKKYMEKNPDLALLDLLRMDDRKIFEESKYRPK